MTFLAYVTADLATRAVLWVRPRGTLSIFAHSLFALARADPGNTVPVRTGFFWLSAVAMGFVGGVVYAAYGVDLSFSWFTVWAVGLCSGISFWNRIFFVWIYKMQNF